MAIIQLIILLLLSLRVETGLNSKSMFQIDNKLQYFKKVVYSIKGNYSVYLLF
jgi:hypothetical protein